MWYKTHAFLLQPLSFSWAIMLNFQNIATEVHREKEEHRENESSFFIVRVETDN
jgi:hypothetical protein